MQTGIFTHHFIRPTLEETLDAVLRLGVRHVQFNLSDAGLDDMPEVISDTDIARINRAFAERKMVMSAISGTFNMAHPDPAVRQDGLRLIKPLAEACPALGSPAVTLCTGTRNRDSMWRPHPDNNSPEAWADMRATMEAAAEIAEAAGVTLALEPEVSNVVDSAQKARRLIDEVGSERIKVCMDGANLYHAGELPRMREILDEAFDLLADDIVIAHGKDLDRDGEAGHLAAGTGLLDYDYYLAGLQRIGYDGPILLHSLTEAQAPGCVAFLEDKIVALK